MIEDFKRLMIDSDSINHDHTKILHPSSNSVNITISLVSTVALTIKITPSSNLIWSLCAYDENHIPSFLFIGCRKVLSIGHIDGLCRTQIKR